MADDSTSRYLVSINYMGEDVQVVTANLATANLLLNDQHAAFAFLNQLDPEKYPIPGGSRDTHVPVMNFDVPQWKTQSLNEETPSAIIDKENKTIEEAREEIWCKKKPSDTDLMATELFLSLREQYKDKFNDTKTSKASVWKIISNKMIGEKYNLGKEPVEKCRQKWANLQKKYLEHLRHLKTTGVEKKDSPPYFDILHGILGSKDKSTPRMLIDSEDVISQSTVMPSMLETSQLTEADNQTQKINKIKQRFKSTVVPKTATAKICEVIKEKCARDRKQEKEHFEKIEQILQTQNAQRREFLEIFKTVAPTEPRKRRRHNIEDSDSD